MPGIGSAEVFIDDAEHHNQWWSDGSSPEISKAVKLTPRSDFHRIIKNVNKYLDDGAESLLYAMRGQTGIGKTVLLHQIIAELLETVDFEHQGRDLELTSSVRPRQILYIPLEASLYQLEQPDIGINRLRQVIDYFQTHVSSRQARRYVFLDDVQALDLDEDRKAELLDILDSNTYLFITGIVDSQVDLQFIKGAEHIDEFEGPWPILPMKFLDAVESGDGLGIDIDPELGARIESYRSKALDGSSPIRTIRYGLNLKYDDVSLDTAVETLSELHFETFNLEERNHLHDAAQAYLRTGGTLQQKGTDPSIRNELSQAHFLLFLYKELASYRSIQQPENLHRLSAIAATEAGEELRYTDLSEQIGVDRRTVDSYLDALDEGIAVTESHDYSLRRYRRTRLYLRNPRHLVLLSQRQEHYGFEAYDPTDTLNHEFEYKLARTVAFDHAMRLAYTVGTDSVEYTDTDAGLVDYILHREGKVLPFVLSYHPYTDNAEEIVTAFDPSSGQHTEANSEEIRDLNYQAPYRFVITDSLPKEVREDGSLVIENEKSRICYLPFWLFLLIC